MGVLEDIYQRMMTYDKTYLAIVITFYTIIWTILNIKMYKQLLDIDISRKRTIIWFLLEAISISFGKIMFPPSVYKIVNLVLFPIITNLILKVKMERCLVLQLIDYMAIYLIELLFAQSLSKVFGIDGYFEGMCIPAYRLIMVGIILISEYIIYRIIKWKNIVMNFPKVLSRKQKVTIIISCILGLLVITCKSVEFVIFKDLYHYIMYVIDTSFIVLTFILSMKHMMNISIVEKRNEEIEELELYNQNLNELYDNVRAFRHDFGNIVQAMGGYIKAEDTQSLKIMYKDLLKECQENNELELLNPKLINDPAIYNIINHKYNKAKKEKVKMNIEILSDLEKLKIDTYEFSRMLGILLDNAIEAAKKGTEKIVELKIAEEMRYNRSVMIVKNTYNNEKIDLKKLYEKGYTTKQESDQRHGLGLWEVQKIINRNDNLRLATSIEGDFFKQQLNIYECA